MRNATIILAGLAMLALCTQAPAQPTKSNADKASSVGNAMSDGKGSKRNSSERVRGTGTSKTAPKVSGRTQEPAETPVPGGM